VRILHYTPAYAPAWSYGGPVQSIARLCEGLAALGHYVEVLTTDAGVSPLEDIPRGRPHDRNGVCVTYFSRSPGYGIRCPELERVVSVRVKEFDLVHVTGVWQRTSFAACRSARAHEVPYVVSPRGALGPYSWCHKTVKKTAYWHLRERSNVRGASAVHYSTLQEWRQSVWLGLPGRAFVVPNPFDFSSLAFDPEGARRWREEIGVGQDEFLILSVGRLHHVKGLDLLPGALAPHRELSWRLVIVGDDEDGTWRSLERSIRSAQLSDRIRFVGAVSPSAISRVYSAADLFVLPSRHESFGNVVVESTACGCPVMITPQVGVSEEVAREGAGFVVNRGLREWSEALRHAIGRPPELASARRRAVEFSRAFDSGKVAAQMVREYEVTAAETWNRT
jgi:glycosyltransferase involved in cell wall biosynthesis